ncbi:MAG: methyltransferase domain-containing protein, partial [Thermomicrobiales bacterium]|nr:methyltransferase domain-containing protein [Thermomicrobiales bacterium]
MGKGDWGMAYDELLAHRIRQSIATEFDTVERPMFGGVVLLIDGNAAVGVIEEDLIVRVGPSLYDEAIRRPYAHPLRYLERDVKDWVAVERAGLHDLGVLSAWIDEGITYARSLPACPRYAVFPDLRDRVIASLRPGMRILDVGAGATPTISPSQRPANVYYVGLDISREELERAPDGSYDEIRVRSALEVDPELVGTFDVVVTLQTLEHIRPLDDAIDNLRAYLRPGGSFY